MPETPLRPPKGLQARGRAFWKNVTAVFELSVDETELLVEVTRTIDQCESLAAVLEHDGLTTTGASGQVRAHPVIAELRASRLCLSRLLGQLALPDESGATMSTPQRVRARSAAAARWSAPQVGSSVSDAARDAASARWAKGRPGA